MPTTIIQTIVDKNGNYILPRTRIEAVYLADNTTTLEDAIGNGLLFKGTVSDYASLPSADQKVGDLYYVTADEVHYFWNGTDWAATGGGSVIAADVSITDTGTYYTSNNVENALQEVGQNVNDLHGFAIAMAIALG